MKGQTLQKYGKCIFILIYLHVIFISFFLQSQLIVKVWNHAGNATVTEISLEKIQSLTHFYLPLHFLKLKGVKCDNR